MEEATQMPSINHPTSPRTNYSIWILKDRSVPQLWSQSQNMKPLLLFHNCRSNIWIIIRKRPLKIRDFSYSKHMNKQEMFSASLLVWTWGTSATYRLGQVIKLERFMSARHMRRWLPPLRCIQAWKCLKVPSQSSYNWTHWWKLPYKYLNLSIFP
jgi:hypothetical protein